MRKTILWLRVCLATLGLAPLGAAQQMPAMGPGAFGAPNSERVTGEIKVLDSDPAPAPGSTFTLSIILKIQDHWKIQAGKSSGDVVEGSWPTDITIDAPAGWNVGELKWPKAQTLNVAGLEARGYTSEAIIEAMITVPSDVTAGAHTIDVTINYQACDASACERPTDLSLSTTITTTGSVEASTPTPATTTKPTDTPPTTTDATAAPAQVYRPTFFGIEIPSSDGVLGLILLIALSMIAGFVLNLTPCVLPVIPIKIMTISAHAGTPGRSLVLGLAMAAGVIAFWVGIGIPAALFTAAADPSRLFGIWWVTLGIGVLIGFMALGIMGLFLIQLPQSVYAINPKADNASGSFLFGVMTGVLGLPCFGFAAGALLAGSAALPPARIMVIFASIGVGMAAPYLVLSAKPGLVSKIPRTGPASELVKQIMGLLLLAAAAYFIGAGLIALVSEKPYMARQLHLWAVAIFASLSGLWLIVRTFQITKSTARRLAFSVIGLVIGSIAVLFATDATAKAKVNWEKLGGMNASNSTFVPGAWNHYTPAALAAARDAGYITVLDFTAEWCINCKVLKATVLDQNPVSSALAKDDIVSFEVDCTSTADPAWDFLHELGQKGIPQLFIYTPGVDRPWNANAYTPAQVMSALEAARASKVAQR